ncbi:MAG: glycoside hydrolase family 16 protein, partial [Bradyrhizobium sp.]
MRLRPHALALIACLGVTPAFGQSDPAQALPQLTLPVPSGAIGQGCRKIDAGDPLTSVSLRRTFHDDFDVHPLVGARWVPHYAGGAAWPEARYWGGEGSDFKRKSSYNGEQQIYVDPVYAGRASVPLGLDPFRVKDGILSIIASRTPPDLKSL